MKPLALLGKGSHSYRPAGVYFARHSKISVYHGDAKVDIGTYRNPLEPNGCGSCPVIYVLRSRLLSLSR